MRGTYDGNLDYRMLDVVTFNGSSWVALENNPGACPGDGWQLLSSCGKRGDRGLKGERGLRGLQGPPGKDAAPPWTAVKVDHRNFAVVLRTTDGRELTLHLRELFEEFDLQKRAADAVA